MPAIGLGLGIPFRIKGGGAVPTPSTLFAITTAGLKTITCGGMAISVKKSTPALGNFIVDANNQFIIDANNQFIVDNS